MRTISFGVLAVMAVASIQPARAQTILGTGSAFAQPLYAKWAQDTKASTGIALNYQAAGSSVGQTQVLKGLTDFGASDVPMEDAKLQEADILQFPTAAGGVAVVVNIPGVAPGQLRLTGDVIADIYMGQIKSWDDARIAALNPGLSLPKLGIAPFYHAGGSGTTYAVARYLAKVSEPWRTKMGVGLTLDWPVGAGVKGSYGAATTVALTTGGIGYAENSYAMANKLSTAQLKNQAGRFVSPSGEAFAAAAENADWAKAKNFAVDLTYQPGERSWPIVTATFVLVPKSPAKAASSATILKFFGWAFAHGDEAAKSLQYVPLPRSVKAQIEGTWGKQAAR
ncbi:phosphate ABC transporter substrate-binding protein PstS [Methylobacterium brachythecii]|uniref:Phosphate-binding protein PstS n=1 Tax=Methylobacterium brachythecii TaxID=1176177 RepID=A0A7W6AGZ1_9HYPH|nr:phosphate ABC transporter substrate-binding protein PstS [Methylobacterium brachythecii]MBB3900826.1 phosphate transport system substrate-binding protein [Methylobacterium brachythecii]GLS46048.1 phosphate-binding protein PstS [Methylobacterium brachythecii]